MHPIRFEPTERPPQAVAFGLGFQQAALCLAGIVLTPVIIVRAAGIDAETYLPWAIFAALIVSGLTTMLQSKRLWRFGAGYPMLMGTSGAFIAVCIAALAASGPAVLATLVCLSSLFQFTFAARLAALRRLITPTVAGTVIMLIAVTIMPVAFGMLADVPDGTPAHVAPAVACATLLVVVALALRAGGALRLWVPVIGLVAGCIVAWGFGIYDTDVVAQADWIGVPAAGWPGLDLRFDAEFWALLPAFLFVTAIGAIETVGDSMAIQEVSWRRRRPTDFREVQGAVAADGVGNLLSGLSGTVPNTTYSTSIAVTELTGIAARSVGVWIGVVLIAAAFLPKVAALLIAVPSPVAAAFLTVLLSLLFVLGLRMVARDAGDYRKAVIAGVSFWVGVGFQNQAVFADQLGDWWGTLLGNGMTAGGLTAIVLTALLEALAPRRRRLKTTLRADAVSEIDAFLRDFASRRRWSDAAAARLCSAGEEALLSLIAHVEELGEETDAAESADRQLLLIARPDGADAELEFVAAAGETNLENRLLLLAERADAPAEHEISLRLLRHYASTVRHQQYHGTDIVTVRVAGRAVATDAP